MRRPRAATQRSVVSAITGPPVARRSASRSFTSRCGSSGITTCTGGKFFAYASASCWNCSISGSKREVSAISAPLFNAVSARRWGRAGSDATTKLASWQCAGALVSRGHNAYMLHRTMNLLRPKPAGRFSPAALFHPDSVAVIGAGTPMGAEVMRNLRDGGFKGAVLPVDPTLRAVAGVLAYPAVADLPVAPDLAVLADAGGVAAALPALAARGCFAAVVLTEFDGLAELARRTGVRALGPDSFGLAIPGLGLNASRAHLTPTAGRLALVSQSASLCRAVLDWAGPNGVGFSHIIGIGDNADLGFGTALDWLSRDPGTGAILLDLRRIKNRRAFISAARAASRLRPVVAIRPGGRLRDARHRHQFDQRRADGGGRRAARWVAAGGANGGDRGGAAHAPAGIGPPHPARGNAPGRGRTSRHRRRRDLCRRRCAAAAGRGGGAAGRRARTGRRPGGARPDRRAGRSGDRGTGRMRAHRQAAAAGCGDGRNDRRGTPPPFGRSRRDRRRHAGAGGARLPASGAGPAQPRRGARAA